jgi:hypothetical protein
LDLTILRAAIHEFRRDGLANSARRKTNSLTSADAIRAAIFVLTDALASVAKTAVVPLPGSAFSMGGEANHKTPDFLTGADKADPQDAGCTIPDCPMSVVVGPGVWDERPVAHRFWYIRTAEDAQKTLGAARLGW